MKGLLLFIAIFNIVDGFATALGLTKGAIQEGNPIMADLWELSPILFLSVKLLLSVLIVILIKEIDRIHSMLVKTLLGFSGFLYTYVFFLHLFWLNLTF